MIVGRFTLEKVSIPVRCGHCDLEAFGMQIKAEHEDDEDGERDMRWTALPPGWWYFPIYYGDATEQGAPLPMLHAFCSETCVTKAIAQNQQVPAPTPPREQDAPCPPSTAVAGDGRVRRRHAGGEKPSPGVLHASLSDLLARKARRPT